MNIEFRGKTEDGSWVYGNLIKVRNNEENDLEGFSWGIQIFKGNTFKGIQQVEEKTIGQFVNLTTDDGVKIFVGDILLDEYLNGNNRYHRVYYINGGFGVDTFRDEFYMDVPIFVEPIPDMQTSSWLQSRKVVGNIHDNPELLEKIKEEYKKKG